MPHRAKWPCFWVGDLGAMMVVCAHKGLARRTHQLRHQLHTSKLFSLSHTFFLALTLISGLFETLHFSARNAQHFLGVPTELLATHASRIPADSHA